MEVPLGIIPGGGACVNLGRFLGVARTMEAGQNPEWVNGRGNLSISAACMSDSG